MKNILIIVDDVKLRLQITNFIRMNPFHAISASNYWEGIQLVQEQYPDLIITDLDVSQNDGYQLLKQIRELTFGNRTPILLLSNQFDGDFILKVWQLGIAWFIPKTVNIDCMMQMISGKLNGTGTIK